MFHPFIEKETRNLRLLRLIGFGFLLSVDVLLVSSLGYVVFQNYQERDFAGSFWDFAGLPLALSRCSYSPASLVFDLADCP